MAVEQRRGCGYRKVGGTYMVGSDSFAPCDRLPFELKVCPCCGEGYRPSRGLREINPFQLFGGEHEPGCNCTFGCVVCSPPDARVESSPGFYLEWIGGSFYKDPQTFMAEALQMGISRRLKGGVPRHLEVGRSVVYLAHREIIFTKRVARGGFSRGIFEKGVGIFGAFVVKNLEHICTQSEFDLVKRGEWWEGFGESELKELSDSISRTKKLIHMVERGVKLVPVPDNDPDHR